MKVTTAEYENDGTYIIKTHNVKLDSSRPNLEKNTVLSVQADGADAQAIWDLISRL